MHGARRREGNGPADPKMIAMASLAHAGSFLQYLDEEGRLLHDFPPLPHAVMAKMYRSMKRVRILDERMIALQRQGRIGFYGAATGEEAAVIGSAQALRPGDWVFPALRQGGVLLHRGLSIQDYVNQVMGNSGDLHKGHQMPCHYSSRAFNHVAWSSCMATQLPHAVGAAYAAKFLKEETVAMAYLGDGATSEGDFHVAMNFAGVFRVPVVFFCHNNQWAISVPVEKQTASVSIAAKAAAYGVEGVQADGNDVLACYRAASDAVEKARKGGGATLIEALTFRIGAHSTSDDPRIYRDETLVERWKKRDPIDRFRKYLEREKLWSAADETKIEAELQAEITAAIEKGESLPPPAEGTLFEDTYAAGPA